MKAVLLSCLLFATVASAEQPLATYPGAIHTRIGNDLEIGGEYYRLAYFTTKDDPETVVRYFQDYWEKLGYPTTVDRVGNEAIIISALYTREGLMRSVIVRRHQDKTLGFTVLKDLWVTAPEKPNPDLVVLEGSVFQSQMSARDETGGSRTQTQLVDSNMLAARDDVMKKLEAQGFKLDRETQTQQGDGSQRVLEFYRGHDQASVAITEVDDGTVTVHETLVSSSRPDGLPTSAVVRKNDANKKKEPKK